MALSDKLDQIVGDIVGDLPGAGVQDIRIELARKCKEFCERSRVWRVVCAITQIPAGATSVSLGNATDGARIVTLDQVWYGRGIAARSFLPWRLCLDGNGGDMIDFRRCPSPFDAWDIRFSASLAPVTNFLMPEWIYEKYGSYLAAGVISRMKRRIKREYSDIQGAQMFDADWRRGIGYAAAEATGTNAAGIPAEGGEGWSIEEGPENRSIPSVIEYGQLLSAFRTLASDLVRRGYLQEAPEI